ncbi:hypothetical protein S1OALGB6SA_6 [Olavius algarvensis spirochete endosymbiont]|nr:hypothetical protein S1OALGB6SA_6 [Olavius algarvensis spirochete endosymbiont]
MFCDLKNELALTGLDVLSNPEDCYYKDMPPLLVRRLKKRL